MFAVGVNILRTGAQRKFLKSVSKNSGMYSGKYNWNHIMLMGLLVVAMCDLKMVTAIDVTPNSATLEEEVNGQLVEIAGEKRLHWGGLPDDMDESNYCTQAAENEYIASESPYEVLRNISYVYKTNWPAFTATVLKCTRKINSQDIKYLTVSKNDNTCAYVFVKSRGTKYILQKKVCGLPAVVPPSEESNDEQGNPSSSSSQQ